MKYWFAPWKWIYKPINLKGWSVTIVFLMFCLHVFVVIDSQSYSVSDTFYGVFPYIVPTFLLWLWVASKKSR